MNKLVSMDEIVPIMREQIAHGGKVRFTPKGNSMLPLFRNNLDTVTLEKPEFPLKKYSIVLYQRKSGQYVLHRMVGIRDIYYIMRGDNQYRNEYGISEDQIIAVVSEFTRKGKSAKVTDTAYRIYSVLWSNTVFIRKRYKLLRRALGKIKRKILRKRNEKFK